MQCINLPSGESATGQSRRCRQRLSTAGLPSTAEEPQPWPSRPESDRPQSAPERNTTSCNVLKERAGQERKSLSRRTFRSTSPAPEALLSMSTAPSWVATRLAPRAGLVVVQASRWAMRIQRTKTMASKQPRKQTKSAPNTDDTGEANKPASDRQRAPRRRVSKARSGSAATETSSAAVLAGVAPEGASESIDLSKNTLGRRGINHHNPSPPRRAPICRPPMFPVLALIGRGRAQSARC